jgi:hypothetical protein
MILFDNVIEVLTAPHEHVFPVWILASPFGTSRLDRPILAAEVAASSIWPVLRCVTRRTGFVKGCPILPFVAEHAIAGEV